MIKKIKLERYHYIALTGWIAKVFTVIFSLINTRLLLNLIGVDGFALYSIIFSLVGWLALLNFALPSSIQNIISEFRAKDKNIEDILDTVSFIVISIIIIVIPLLYILSYVLYDFLLLNYHNLITLHIFYINIILLFLFGIMELFNRILFALNKGYLPNIYPAIIAILGFVILYLLNYYSIKDTETILLYFFTPYLLLFIISYIQAIGFRIPKFHKEVFKRILKLVKYFFIFAILSAFIFRSDYLVMSLIGIDSQNITEYNINMRLFGLILFMYGTIMSALWPISAELFHKKEYLKIKSNLIKNIKFGILFAFIIGILFIYFKDSLFLLISGNKTINISLYTGTFTMIYIIIRLWSDSFITILQSMNEIKILIIVYILQAILSIILQYKLGILYGINGIIIGITSSFLLTTAWILPYRFFKIIASNERNE